MRARARVICCWQLEDAQNQVRRLQQELLLRDEATDMRRSQALLAERNAWKNELNIARSNLEQLQRRLEEREQLLEDGFQRTDKSLETIYMQADEIENLREVLDAQRAEIRRLNGLLDRLLGMRSDEVQPADVATLHQDINALRSTLIDGGRTMGSGYQSPQCFQQPTHVSSQPNLSQVCNRFIFEIAAVVSLQWGILCPPPFLCTIESH